MISGLIDTHTHIDLPEFEDAESIINRAKEFGIEKMVVPSVDVNSFENVLKLSQQYDNVYCALGIHPTEAQNAKDDDYDRIIELSKFPKVVGIGECGLDYYWDKTFQDEQKKCFVRQIEIAKTLKKPLLVHDRDAHKDSFDLIVENSNGEMPVIMHCFSGSLEFAKECIKKDFYIALGGVVTFKNAKKTHEVAKNIPLEKLLLETDAPYLTPEPHRGERNEPAYVKFVAQRIAELRGISFEEVAQTTTENAKKVFGF